MRTYSHGIIGYLLYLKGTKEQQMLSAIGAMLPDIFLAIGFLFHVTPDNGVTNGLHNLLHHSFLHEITKAMHSFVFVIPLLILAFFFFKNYFPFFVGMLSHVIVDLLTHQKSSYNSLFPIPMEHLVAPVSYTSTWFTIAEHVFVLAFVVWILWKFYSKKKAKKKK